LPATNSKKLNYRQTQLSLTIEDAGSQDEDAAGESPKKMLRREKARERGSERMLL
jgi:hypothetical protein